MDAPGTAGVLAGTQGIHCLSLSNIVRIDMPSLSMLAAAPVQECSARWVRLFVRFTHCVTGVVGRFDLATEP